MKKIIVPAFVLAILSLLSSVVNILNMEYFTKNGSSFLIFLLVQFIISALIFLYYIKHYKFLYCNNSMNFVVAFRHGLKITIAWSLTASLLFVTHNFLNKATVEKAYSNYFQQQKEKIIEVEGSISAGDLNNLQQNSNIINNPMVSFGITLLNTILLGLFLSLIAAAIFKTNVVEEKTII